MAADLEIKSGGSWRSIVGVEVKSGDVWRNCHTVWVKSGGTWREVFSARGTLLLSGVFVSDADPSSPYSSEVGVRVNTDGSYEELVGASWSSVATDTWIDAFSGAESSSDYECKLVKTSGVDPTSGPALDTWHTISTARDWRLLRTTLGSSSFVGVMHVREIANTSNEETSAVSLFVENGTL